MLIPRRSGVSALLGRAPNRVLRPHEQRAALHCVLISVTLLLALLVWV